MGGGGGRKWKAAEAEAVEAGAARDGRRRRSERNHHKRRELSLPFGKSFGFVWVLEKKRDEEIRENVRDMKFFIAMMVKKLYWIKTGYKILGSKIFSLIFKGIWQINNEIVKR